MKHLIYRIIFFLILFTFVSFGLCFAEKLSIPDIKILNKSYKCIQKGNYSDAINILETYIKQNTNVHPTILFYLANAYMMNKKYNMAIPILLSLIKKHKNNIKIYVMLASCYYQIRKYEDAAKLFLKAYKTSKKEEYLYNSALCNYLIGKKIDAYNLMKDLISSNNNKFNWIQTYINILLDLKKYKEALFYVEKLLNSKIKDKIKYQEIKINLCILLKRFDYAINYLETLLENSPFNLKWWNYLINIYLMENKYKDGLAVLLIKGYITPNTQKENKLIADLFMQLDVPKEALKYYLKLSSRDDKRIFFIIAQCYLRLGDIEKGLYWSKKACDLDNTYDSCYLTGEILYNLRRFNEALDHFLSAAKVAKKPYRAYLMAGKSAFYGKKYDDAKRYLKMALKDMNLKREITSLMKEISKIKTKLQK